MGIFSETTVAFGRWLSICGCLTFLIGSHPLHAEPLPPSGTSTANTLLNDYYQLRLKDPASAKMILIEAVKKYPYHEYLQSELGYLLLREEQYQEALIHLKVAHQLNPENTDYTMQIGYTLNKLHQYDEAIEYFRNVAEYGTGINKVKADDILQKMGQQTMVAGSVKNPQKKTAVQGEKQVFNEAQKTEDLDVLRPYEVLLKFNRPQANVLLDKILEKYPDNAMAIREKGRQKMQDGDFREAIALFLKAQSLQPDEETALLLGTAYARWGDLRQARYWFGKGVNASSARIRISSSELLEALKTGSVPQNPTSGLSAVDLYYAMKDSEPAKARQMLEAIVKAEPDNARMQAEMGYSLLKARKQQEALFWFLKAHALDASNGDVTLQLAYLYLQQKNREKARGYFRLALQSADPAVREKAQEGLKGQEAPTPKTKAAVTISPYDRMMNTYYAVSKTSPAEARKLLEAVLQKYPEDYRALREMGFLLVREKQHAEAISYFISAWNLRQDSFDLALQIGYLLDDIGQKQKAYAWFERAFLSPDPEIQRKSYESMINLGSQRFQFFNPPWFADFWSAPFSYSRFDLFIVPEHTRVGRAFGRRKQIEVYYNNYVNKDNRSNGGPPGALPIIFEDNYVLNGAGIRYYTKTKVPLVFYFEGGMAYDLIYRDRDRWRDDWRGGVLSWYDWSPLPTYAEKLRFPFVRVGDFYGDSSFFSRYDDDWISYGRIREGYRFLQYKNVSMSAYARGFIIGDTNKYFYNNLFEYGPGVALYPNNKWPVALRYERRFGQYINVSGPEVNPYGPRYTTNVTMLEMYYRF